MRINGGIKMNRYTNTNANPRNSLSMGSSTPDPSHRDKKRRSFGSRKPFSNNRYSKKTIVRCYGKFRAVPKRCATCEVQRLCAEDTP
jgi:hypothetical protein